MPSPLTYYIFYLDVDFYNAYLYKIYSMEKEIGKLSKTRERIRTIVTQIGDIITVSDVAEILNIDSSKAAATLSRWQQQGWLTRVKRGTYVYTPPEYYPGGPTILDPVLVLPHLLQEFYIGGFSALSHWDFTDQIFIKYAIFTADPVMKTKIRFIKSNFVCKHIKDEMIFGTVNWWHEGKKFLISDPHKTIIDVLTYPGMGGGIMHVKECLQEYLGSDHFEPNKLISYAEKQSKGSVFKRLGFLLDKIDGNFGKLQHECTYRLTKGYSKIDPKLECDQLITRWNLWVPRNWEFN